jgi:hypothetical protein
MNHDDMKSNLLRVLPTPVFYSLRRWNFRLRDSSSFAATQRRRRGTSDAGYSLLPFDQTQSIFVHIPKCAGMSITKALYGNLAGGHTTFDRYLLIFSSKEIRSYFKFTIVRNPWDRLVSAYHFLQGGGFDEKDRQFAKSELEHFSSFDEFVRNWVDSASIWKCNHFRPQYHYFLDQFRRVPLDFVGRFENLQADFEYICDRLGVQATLPNVNASRHRDYRGYYTPETRKIVASVYATDIDLLGYEFDGS